MKNENQNTKTSTKKVIRMTSTKTKGEVKTINGSTNNSKE